MLIKKKTGIDIPSSEITPQSVYLSRRAFMGGAAAVAGAVALAACAPKTDLSGAGSAARMQATAEAEIAAPATAAAPPMNARRDKYTDWGVISEEGMSLLVRFLMCIVHSVTNP